jgi:iron complex transport system ATP-binding protein
MHQSNPRALCLSNVAVQRGRVRVLEDVSVKLRAGEIVAVVGPNGAGKTTLLEAALGAVPLARGRIDIDGEPVRGFAGRTRAFAHLAAEAEPPLELRADRFVQLAGARAEPGWSLFLRQRLGIDALGRAPASALSRGERRRLLLFEALSSSKPFLLLDEPTGVFDPLQLLDVVGAFHAAAERGAGVLVTVHQMSDAEAIASRIMILSRGRQVALGTLGELRGLAGLGSSASLQDVFLTLLQAQRGPHAGA